MYVEEQAKLTYMVFCFQPSVGFWLSLLLGAGLCFEMVSFYITQLSLHSHPSFITLENTGTGDTTVPSL